MQVGLDPSKVVVTKLKMDKDRRALLERKAAGRGGDKAKGKFSEQEVAAMENIGERARCGGVCGGGGGWACVGAKGRADERGV